LPLITTEKLSELVKLKAIQEGFDAVGFAPARVLSEEKERLEEYISERKYAGMEYLKNNAEKLLNPALVFSEAKSVIVVLQNYYPANHQNADCRYRVSKYAYGKDYHKLIKEKLKKLSDYIIQQREDASTMLLVDSGTLLEKTWAIQAGIAWRGKNSLTLNKNSGSFFFIGIILCSLELSYNSHITESQCGNCNLCVESCPINALEPYKLNPTKCISYHTIENKNKIPKINNTHGWIYGCDVCQDVCPYNAHLKSCYESHFRINDFIYEANNHEWEQLTKELFHEYFFYSPIYRLGYKQLKKNIERII